MTVRRGTRVVARARSRAVRASQRTLRVALNRRLAAGRYRVHVSAEANGVRVTRALTFRARG